MQTYKDIDTMIQFKTKGLIMDMVRKETRAIVEVQCHILLKYYSQNTCNLSSMQTYKDIDTFSGVKIV